MSYALIDEEGNDISTDNRIILPQFTLIASLLLLGFPIRTHEAQLKAPRRVAFVTVSN